MIQKGVEFSTLSIKSNESQYNPALSVYDTRVNIAVKRGGGRGGGDMSL